MNRQQAHPGPKPPGVGIITATASPARGRPARDEQALHFTTATSTFLGKAISLRLSGTRALASRHLRELELGSAMNHASAWRALACGQFDANYLPRKWDDISFNLRGSLRDRAQPKLAPLQISLDLLRIAARESGASVSGVMDVDQAAAALPDHDHR